MFDEYKTQIQLLIIFLLVAFGIGAYMFSQRSSDEDKKTLVVQNKNEALNKGANSRYVAHFKTALDDAVPNRRVLFFYANWCSTCQPADANLRANTGRIPEDMTVIRVNYNDPETDQDEKDLAKKYNVVYQHTFVQIDKEGNVVTRWSGGQIDELLAKTK